ETRRLSEPPGQVPCRGGPAPEGRSQGGAAPARGAARRSLSVSNHSNRKGPRGHATRAACSDLHPEREKRKEVRAGRGESCSPLLPFFGSLLSSSVQVRARDPSHTAP